MLRSTLVMDYSLLLRRRTAALSATPRSKRERRTDPDGGSRSKSVANLRHSAAPFASAAQTKLVHLAVQRRPGHAKFQRRLRNVAAGARERAVERSALRGVDAVAVGMRPSDQIRRRDRPRQSLRVN